MFILSVDDINNMHDCQQDPDNMQGMNFSGDMGKSLYQASCIFLLCVLPKPSHVELLLSVIGNFMSIFSFVSETTMPTLK